MEKIFEEKIDRIRGVIVILLSPFLIFGVWVMTYLIKISYSYFIEFRAENLLGLIYASLFILMISAFTWFVLTLFLSMVFNKTELYYDRCQSKIKIKDFYFTLFLFPKMTTYEFDLVSIDKIIRYRDIDKITLTHNFFVLESNHIASFPPTIYSEIVKLKDFDKEIVNSTEISVREFGKMYNLKNKWWRGSKSESRI